MNESQLRSFVETARAGSFNKAAEILYQSPPAIKYQIDSLERELSTTLLERNSRGVSPTDAGVGFLEFAENILQSITDEKARLAMMTKKSSGTVRLGTNIMTEINDPCSFADLLSSFKKPDSSRDIVIEFSNTFDFARFDAFIGDVRDVRDDVVPNRLLDMPLYCIVPRDHPLATLSEIDASILADVRLSLPPSGLFDDIKPDLSYLLERPSATCRPGGWSHRDYLQTQILDDGMVGVVIGLPLTPLGETVSIKMPDFVFHYNVYTKKNERSALIKAYLESVTAYYVKQVKQGV